MNKMNALKSYICYCGLKWVNLLFSDIMGILSKAFSFKNWVRTLLHVLDQKTQTKETSLLDLFLRAWNNRFCLFIRFILFFLVVVVKWGDAKRWQNTECAGYQLVRVNLTNHSVAFDQPPSSELWRCISHTLLIFPSSFSSCCLQRLLKICLLAVTNSHILRTKSNIPLRCCFVCVCVAV